VIARVCRLCLLLCPLWVYAAAEVPESPEELSEIVVQTPEPRFVAPTLRDQIGRIWAPVMINGKGPFRLVLDTGANRSGVTKTVADVLHLPLDQSPPFLLHGVTGIATVPTIRVDSVSVGDLWLSPETLAILTDPLGGASGVLGTEGFADKRIVIDFGHDRIRISRSHGERARLDFVTIPFDRSESGLLMVRASVGGVSVHAIIDTGGQRTLANLAMRDALVRRHAKGKADEIMDVTTKVQTGETFPGPPLKLGSIEIRGTRITYSDMSIFQHWHLEKEPALLIGMDVIGLLDTFIIDYRRRELQLRMRVQ
jgi:predicted aspartyl protease